jgi:hypothetical protein
MKFWGFWYIDIETCQFGFGSLNGPFISKKLILVGQAELWCKTFWPNWLTQLRIRNVAMYSYFHSFERKRWIGQLLVLYQSKPKNDLIGTPVETSGPPGSSSWFLHSTSMEKFRSFHYITKASFIFLCITNFINWHIIHNLATLRTEQAIFFLFSFLVGPVSVNARIGVPDQISANLLNNA